MGLEAGHNLYGLAEVLPIQWGPESHPEGCAAVRPDVHLLWENLHEREGEEDATQKKLFFSCSDVGQTSSLQHMRAGLSVTQAFHWACTAMQLLYSCRV